VLLVSYLASYLWEFQRWLSEWRTVINVSKSDAIIFAQAGQRFIQPRPVTLFGDPILWVDTTCYQKFLFCGSGFYKIVFMFYVSSFAMNGISSFVYHTQRPVMNLCLFSTL
jgi:hypothetical protein